MKKRINTIKKKGISFITCAVVLFLVLSPFSARKTHSAEGLKEMKPPVHAIQNYSYKWVGRPDPFKPFIETDLQVRKKVERQASANASLLPISPLQRLELDAIRVVGIAGDDHKKKAIVEDRQRKFYPVYVGTYIGTNNGMIKEILDDRVVVEEKSKALGKIKVNLITMKLHTSEDEGKP